MNWRVRDVMTRDVVSVRPETPFKECVEMTRVHGIGALPVLDKEARILGILSESDLLRKEEVKDGLIDARASARRADEAMTSALVSIAPGATIAEAARLMHETSVRHLPVIDVHGGLVGILARADLLKVFLRSDESIRREIDEELLPRAFGIPHGDLDIDVREGVVHIGGEVETDGLARLIPAFVDRVEGVVGVESTLAHRRDDQPARPTAAVS